jgi:hypothetical protein
MGDRVKNQFLQLFNGLGAMPCQSKEILPRSIRKSRRFSVRNFQEKPNGKISIRPIFQSLETPVAIVSF